MVHKCQQKLEVPKTLQREILYHAQTSGTQSETPSIVSVPTEAIFSNVECFIRRFEDTEGDPTLVLSPFSFDPGKF